MKCSNLGVLLFSVMVLVSCKKEEEVKEVENVTTETIEKETVIIRDTVEVAKPEEKKGTSVKVSGDGVELNSKDIDVDIKK
ncbi:hypothetical protein [Flavobacterium dankookense]|uniref:Uncharacterized protein n=1 Tax=Flavobacterium dankookense TaxID=706186 RepID=A0A4R6Q6E9_9FLAO|nr:hypothetical protein [Flavobacterium dankookense]TDP57605.1 hypothetical protein BC748_2819 [Flavobacterium dankookense]